MELHYRAAHRTSNAPDPPATRTPGLMTADHAIGVAGAVFLLYLIVLVPAMAFRSARVFNAPADDPVRNAIPSRATIYLNTIVVQLVLFALAWFAARAADFRLFALPRAGTRELIAGAAALLFQFAMMCASHAVRAPSELGDMAVDRVMPRSPRERALYSALSVVAGMSEEAAYRGVLMFLLGNATGSAWLAMLVSAFAFAVGHAVQGRKSMAVIFVMACSMHALVWYTGTLVIAMAVHGIYDLLAPTFRRRILRVPPTGPERSAG
jgi:membrane protease YdiL (CAAX protease family)